MVVSAEDPLPMRPQKGRKMNITINASGNSNVTITGNENLISNDTMSIFKLI
jgi:hypothetical protein